MDQKHPERDILMQLPIQFFYYNSAFIGQGMHPAGALDELFAFGREMMDAILPMGTGTEDEDNGASS